MNTVTEYRLTIHDYAHNLPKPPKNKEEWESFLEAMNETASQGWQLREVNLEKALVLWERERLSSQPTTQPVDSTIPETCDSSNRTSESSDA